MKILIIGLDGATWEVLDDFVLQNFMPNLNGLKTGGCSGILHSTEPPITPAAWTTCITGCQPYTHGVFGFKDYCNETDELSISSSTSCTVPTIFEELSKQGYKVASINVPWTYPCRKINGFMAAGYGIPSTGAQFTYPDELKNELLEKIKDYEVMAQWENLDGFDDEKFEKNVALVKRNFQQRLETAQIIHDKLNCDVMMVQFQDIDLIQHHIWPCVDKKTRDKYSQQRDRLFLMFKRLDEIIGRLLEMEDSSQSVVAVVSDHGFGPMLGSIRVNSLLYQWGYLKYKYPLGRFLRRMRRNFSNKQKKVTDSVSIELKKPIDWKKSKAMVMYAAMNGHIYLNVKGRNPNGNIERGHEYDECIRDLKERFGQVRCPVTGEKMFVKTATPAELYNTNKKELEKFGDLILVPRAGYITHQSTTKTKNPISLQAEGSPAGCHYPEGIYIFSGHGIKSGLERDAHIVDFAPTIYAAAGGKLPNYIDGSVMTDIFSNAIKIEYESEDKKTFRTKKQALSEEEQQLIHQRLAELGYMD